MSEVSAQWVLLMALSTLLEQRDSNTESHIIRMQHYVQDLAFALRQHPKFAATLTPQYMENVVRLTPLYDLGTAAIPDRVLIKPAVLNPEELSLMRTHTLLGYTAIEQAQKTLGIDNADPALVLVKDMILSHHEKWNGTGYPHGLVGDAIPVSARLVALADAYDSIISSKVYKEGQPHREAVKTIFSERGEHFDPDIVDAFMEIHTSFETIAQHYADTPADMQFKIDYMAKAIAENADTLP